MLSDEELAAIEARANAATKGPWFLAEDGFSSRPPNNCPTVYATDEELRYIAFFRDMFCIAGNPTPNLANAEFTAHARTDIPALLAHVRELRAVVDRLNRLGQDDAAAVKEAAALRAEVEQLRGEVNARGKILDDLQKEAGTGWWYGVLDVLKQLRRERDLAEATNEALVDDAKSLNATFDLRHDADMRAIARWREAHPGSELVMPDHADLCVWLLEQLAAATARAERAEETLDEVRDCLRSADFQLAERLLDTALVTKGESK